MEWQDQGVLLNVRRHGESAAVIEVLSQYHGRHSGLVRGGGGRKMAPLLQTGTQLALTWRARLEEQLGSFSVELLSSRSAFLLADREKLYAFNALAAMLGKYLPEREPNEPLYHSCMELLERMRQDSFWQHYFCRFELGMLQALGYGIELEKCAVTGQAHDLKYISPKSGRAVSREAAKGYEARLLAFPEMLLATNLRVISVEEFGQSLKLTGYFFDKWVHVGLPGLPNARQRFYDLVQR